MTGSIQLSDPVSNGHSADSFGATAIDEGWPFGRAEARPDDPVRRRMG